MGGKCESKVLAKKIMDDYELILIGIDRSEVPFIAKLLLKSAALSHCTEKLNKLELRSKQ